MKKIFPFILILSLVQFVHAHNPLYDSLKPVIKFAIEQGRPIKANMEIISCSDTSNAEAVFDKVMLTLGYKKEICLHAQDIDPWSLYALNLHTESAYLTIVYEKEQPDNKRFDFNILLYYSFRMPKRIHAKLYLWNSRTENMIIKKFHTKPVWKPNPDANLIFCCYSRRFR